MRVLHLCCTSNFAGVERHVTDLASTQSERGDDVTVLGGDVAAMASAASDQRVTFTAYEGIPSALRILRGASRPDVVNVHMSTAELVAALSPALARVPLVATRHFAAPRGARRLTRPAVRLAAHRMAAQIAVSRFVADHMDGTGVVIHSGVRGRPDGFPADGRRRTVLVAQRLEAEKNTALALDAFAASGLAEAGWTLEIAGDGAQAQFLRQQASSLAESSAIHFLGHRSHVDTLMAESGIYLATRGDEAYGLSVLEAMSAGTPVVAAAGGGHLETVGSVPENSLFAVGDVAGAARRLQELASDTVRRDRYGATLQQVQRSSFSLERQADATEAVYRSVL